MKTGIRNELKDDGKQKVEYKNIEYEKLEYKRSNAKRPTMRRLNTKKD